MPCRFRMVLGLLLASGLLIAEAAALPQAPSYAGLTITANAFSADDKQVLVGSREGTVELWDIAAEKQLRHFPAIKPGSISAVTLSADGALAFAANDEGSLSLWRTANAKRIALPHSGKMKIPFAQLSGNGSLLVFVDATWVIHVMDTVKRRLLWKSTKPWPRPITGLHLSPDGQRLLIMDGGGKPALYNLSTRALLCGGEHFDGLQPYSEAAAFSGDSQQLAVADGDFNIVMFSAKTCERGATLRGHRNAISALAFSADATQLVSAGREAVVKVWNLSDGKVIWTQPTLLAETTHVRFSGDAKLVSAWLVAEGTVWNFLQRWNVISGAAIEVKLPIVDAGLVEEKPQSHLDEIAASAPPKMMIFTSMEGGFSVLLPQEQDFWLRSGTRRTESGVQVERYGSGAFPARMIFSRVDASKEKIDTYQSPETFIRIYSRPVLSGYSEIGSEYSEVSDTMVAGRPAKIFERREYEFVDTGETNKHVEIRQLERIKKKVLTYHRYIVISTTGGGFYRLEYAAEEGAFSLYLPVFEAALASFKPIDPPEGR